jgi:L,D-peptidoglycan transpeptidase YkuD (ErfK/YbiS/YcfS/YnhG family)
MSPPSVSNRRARIAFFLARRHRLVGILAALIVVTLVGTVSAFAFTSPAHRTVTLKHHVDRSTIAPARTTTTSTTTTTTEAPVTTAPPPTTPPPPPPTTVAPPPTAPRPTVVTPVPPIPTPTCASALPALLATTDGASQMITVEASGYGVTSATLTGWTQSGSCWTVSYGPWTARLGYTGLSTDKHEGDGATPAGIFGFQSTFYGNAPNPGVHYPYRQLQCGDWWDEDSSSPTYNTFQEVPCSDTNPPFDNGSSEALWTETQAYPSFAVINYNPSRVPGLGSAIFLHADVGGPTDGCVSLPLGELDSILDWLQPGQDPAIVLGTAAGIAAY